MKPWPILWYCHLSALPLYQVNSLQLIWWSVNQLIFKWLAGTWTNWLGSGIVLPAIVAGWRAIITKIMIGLVNSLASNRHQAIDEDQGYFMDHQVCYLALFSWVDNMHELMTHPDWTWEFQFAWHHAISNVSMTMAKGTNGSSDKILLCFISKKETKFLEKLSFTQK